ncbi:MAG TPA: PHB depolymerase family esterase [Candidatus Thermoplasmatota archaeon]|nr:PHB depolymerase family esterase [Candidatus Thermoplasmatota archaeon]
MKTKNEKVVQVILMGILLTFIMVLTGCMYKIPENPHTFTRTINADGLQRTYRIHIPPELPVNSTSALLFVLHGGGGTGEGMERSLTLGGFNAIADQQNCIVVYPDGIEKNWNDGRKNVSDPAHQQNIDDVGFFAILIENLSQEFNIDPHRIFVTGISNGAMMSYRLACEIPEKIAAIAPVAGALPIDLLSLNISDASISVCVISGTHDPLVPWEGGLVGFPRNPRGIVLSVPESVLFWVSHNNCSSPPNSTVLPDRDPTDHTWVQKDTYSNGANATEVTLYTIYNGGHTWPDGYQYFPESLIGRTTHDINANTVIWDFFSVHPKI